MKLPIPFAERLIVAADFKPEKGQVAKVVDKVLALADALKGTEVYLKANSALRLAGYQLIAEIHARGLRMFADLKLKDIGETLETDGAILAEYRPDILTVMCDAGRKPMLRLKAQLPCTEVLGVTVLTDMDESDTEETYRGSVQACVIRLARLATQAGMDGLILAPKDVLTLQEYNRVRKMEDWAVAPHMTLNTPNVRLADISVKGDDQNPNRSLTPYEAMRAGIDRVVMGRPVTQAPDPTAAVTHILEEIQRGLQDRTIFGHTNRGKDGTDN